MPRKARTKCASGIYHVIMRGHNRQTIFEDDEDRNKYLQTLSDCKTKSGCKIFGYCLMDNHIHLLIKENDENIDITMRRIGASYVYWYNNKYQRCGHLFQDRYRSESVDDDVYFLAVLRYIHQIPVKAGIAKSVSGHKWSSYNSYIDSCGIVDIDFALGMFGNDKVSALNGFMSFHNEGGNIECLEIEDTKKITDQKAQGIIKSKCGIKSCLDLQNFEALKRNEYVRELRDTGLSVRQIARLTGISRVIVQKV